MWHPGRMAEAPSTLLPPFLSVPLSSKRPFKSEGWEDFLLREGTSLICASSPSTFLTRDPFKASGPPWRWHPWCSTLCVPGCQTPWSFFSPLHPLISPFLLCYWWWHAVYLCSNHMETHTLSQRIQQRSSAIARSPQLQITYVRVWSHLFFFFVRAWIKAAMSLRQGTFQE